VCVWKFAAPGNEVNSAAMSLSLKGKKCVYGGQASANQ